MKQFAERYCFNLSTDCFIIRNKVDNDHTVNFTAASLEKDSDNENNIQMSTSKSVDTIPYEGKKEKILNRINSLICNDKTVLCISTSNEIDFVNCSSF